MTRVRPNWAFRAGWALLPAVLLLAGCGAGANHDGAPSKSGPAESQPALTAVHDQRETTLSDVVQLTRGFDRAGEAYFSPDAKWIIFQATPPGEQHYQMYVAPLRWQGGKIAGLDRPVRISPPNSRNTCGYFSPDGRSLIFASTAGKEDPNEPAAGYQRQGGNYRWDFPNGMEIFRADDWQRAVAGNGGDGAVNLAKYPITKNDSYDAEGSYSPDGQWIVFGSRRDGDSELYAMRPDGSDVVRLTNAKGYDGGPFFSPGGRRIVYRSDRKGNDLLQVFTADLAFGEGGRITGSSNERQLTDDGNVNWGPYWYVDGKHIIYATSDHGHQNYELYWMRDDGSGKTRITFTEGFDGLPVFSPDGKYLMWSSKRTANNTTQIFAARFTPPGDAR
jgi:Tol biopolymer transport system component